MYIPGSRFKEIRKALKLNQKEFAKRLGLKQNTVSDVENDKYSFSQGILDLIVLELCVNPDWLKSGYGEMFVTKDTAIKFLSARDQRISQGTRLALIRNILNIDFADFAEEIKISPNLLICYERGQYNLSEQTIKLVSILFNVNYEWLENGSGEMFSKSRYNTFGQLIHQAINGDFLNSEEKRYIMNFLFDKKELIKLREQMRKINNEKRLIGSQINNNSNVANIGNDNSDFKIVFGDDKNGKSNK